MSTDQSFSLHTLFLIRKKIIKIQRDAHKNVKRGHAQEKDVLFDVFQICKCYHTQSLQFSPRSAKHGNVAVIRGTAFHFVLF